MRQWTIAEGVGLSSIQWDVVKTRKKKTPYAVDNIISFDIETTSGFKDKKTGVVEAFDESRPASYYEDKEKISICYIWQASIDTNVYIGRTLESFVDFLNAIESVCPDALKYIYVHNFSFEFQFLRNVIHFESVFAREVRKPLLARWHNFEFRCSYMLTNMSLDSWAKNYNLPVSKKVGQLDYLKLRTPATKLSPYELEYCIDDVRVMYYGLRRYREEYGHIYNIPYTQTGEVRRDVRALFKNNKRYHEKISALLPTSLEYYTRLVRVFAGGYTHANYRYTAEILENVRAYDIASSYPTVMVLEKYPMTRFKPTSNYQYYIDRPDDYAFIVEFEALLPRCKYWNTFLSGSKCDNVGAVWDNGRLRSADYIHAYMTDIDYKLFLECYNCEDINILNMWVSVKGYLPNELCKYILELYRDKTTLKNIEEFIDKYKKQKQKINSVFGMCVTREITDTIVFDSDWSYEKLTLESFDEKIASMRKKPSQLVLAFQFGVYVTAYARRNIWESILAMDSDVVYVDTDSNKHINDHSEWYEAYNKKIEIRSRERAKMLGVDYEEYFAPKDTDGVAHPLGVFEFEGVDDKFITLGAKKYLEEKNGVLKMTVAGVRKGAVSQLKSIEDFNDDLTFDIQHAKKNILHYNDEQTPAIWKRGAYDEYTSDAKYGICFQPTTYSMSLTPAYVSLVLENAPHKTDIITKAISTDAVFDELADFWNNNYIAKGV